VNGFSSKAIHGVVLKKDPHGALRFPLYDNAAFEADTARDLELAFLGRKPAHAYSRISNPTVEDFEQRVRLISDAFGVVAVSSGMAAISETVLALAGSGSNIITSRFLFGNTVSLFTTTLGRWGLEVRYADMTDPASVERAIDGKTALVFLEVITNPQLEVADIGAVAGKAAEHDVPVVLDGTLTTPYLFRSCDAGVAVEIVSSTKYMSGGATSIGGIIIDNGVFDWKKSPSLSAEAVKVGPAALVSRLRREVHRNVGACMTPHNAWLQSLGLETLALRVEKSCANALAISRYLESQKGVVSVNYPGLSGSPHHQIAAKQFNGRYGGLLTFDLGAKEPCFKLMDGLKMIRRATNLNDNKTLILHPASTIFCEYSAEERGRMRVTEGMIRLSVGIEDEEDIIADLQQGIESL
jgi:O-acetylhomoserine (thiol)-lyase